MLQKDFIIEKASRLGQLQKSALVFKTLLLKKGIFEHEYGAFDQR